MNSEKRDIKTVLSIAGSDSIGGAGIQADIKTACALGVYAMTAITAVTAQNTLGIKSIQQISPGIIRDQLEQVIADVRPDAVKIGMVGDAEAVRVIAEVLRQSKLTNIVVDPVLVASSGSSLNSDDRTTIDAFFTELFPLADVITPNIPEAIRLLGIDMDFEDPGLMAVRLLASAGARAVLVKGGHGVKEEARDYLLMKTEGGIKSEEFTSPRIETKNNHGTGCTLSTAIACGLAEGLPITDAVRRAKDFVTRALERGRARRLGHGTGPLDFFVPPA